MTSTRRRSPTSASRASTPRWKSAARWPPPDRARPILAPLSSVAAGCGSGWDMRPADDSMPAASRQSLVDGERALHPGRLVVVDVAEERVGAGLQEHGERRDAAVRDDRPLLGEAVALDRDVVRDRRLVGHLDRHPAALRGQLL